MCSSIRPSHPSTALILTALSLSLLRGLKLGYIRPNYTQGKTLLYKECSTEVIPRELTSKFYIGRLH